MKPRPMDQRLLADRKGALHIQTEMTRQPGIEVSPQRWADHPDDAGTAFGKRTKAAVVRTVLAEDRSSALERKLRDWACAAL